MSNKEILERAIKKAVDGGWEPFEFGSPTRIMKWENDHMVNIAVTFPVDGGDVEWVRELEGIIFNKDFAKALWGEDWHMNVGLETQRLQECTDCNQRGFSWHREEPNPYSNYWIYCWQFHLQWMVVADDPMKYLGDNIESKEV